MKSRELNFAGAVYFSARHGAVRMEAMDNVLVPAGIDRGLLISMHGNAFELIECIQARSTSFKIKMRNLITGAFEYKLVKKGSSLPKVMVTQTPVTFLYFNEKDSRYVFMDDATFEEIEVDSSTLGGTGDLLEEGTKVDLIGCEGRVFTIEIRSRLIFEVVEFTFTPKVKGNVNRNAFKTFVRLSNGMNKIGPPYSKVGDKVQLNGQTGEIERRV